MLNAWFQKYPFVSRGLIVAILSLAAIAAVFLNLRGMEQARIDQYRNLAEIMAESAAGYFREGRSSAFMDEIEDQRKISFIEFAGFYVQGQIVAKSGDEIPFHIPEAFLNSAENDSVTALRQGPQLFLVKKVNYQETQGTLAMVFSMSEFHARQQNIVFATLVILALIAAIVGLFYLLDKSRLEIQRKNEDLQKTRERLEAEEKTRSGMVKAIAHDALHYVTVINMIIDNQETSRKKNPEKNGNGSYINEILESNDSLTQLLENLKYSEYLSKGLLINRPRSVAWVEFVDAVLVSMKELFSKKNIKVDFQHHQEPYKVMVDRELAKRVLLNLFHNAFKFTRPNSRLVIWLERESGNVRTMVKDQGAGIPGDKWEEIFEPSVRLDESAFVRAEDKRGSGLGLSNARQFVELSGGKMGVAESEQNQGTTFYFSLPLAGETYGMETEVKK